MRGTRLHSQRHLLGQDRAHSGVSRVFHSPKQRTIEAGQTAIHQFYRALIGQIKRRTEVVGIFPNEEAATSLVGALLLEQNGEWAVQRAAT